MKLETVQELTNICIPVDASLRQAMEYIDRNSKGIVLITDHEHRLVATITDGDIRRAILAGCNLEDPLTKVLEHKKHGLQPVVARYDAPREALLQLMKQNAIQQIPLVDDSGHVVGLVTIQDLIPEESLAIDAVIMAGGFGTRLHPLTLDTPKPMLPIGGEPLLQRIIRQLRQHGIRRITITTHYHAEKIRGHFGDGKHLGVEISYIHEETPLGTAGALSLLDSPSNTLLVINGDILTQVDFRDMAAYHREQGASLTVGVRKYELQVPYGVVESDHTYVQRIVEKPDLCFFVNAGIYLLEPHTLTMIPKGRRFHMTDLIASLIHAHKTVVSFPIVEYWLDVGQPVDYERAENDVRLGRFAA
ncbi:MAG: nucleotidyltransferase family protein [Gemmatales bacterium]|nr:nucleotidyltransferase family protein [Gemmatales bacterium]MDW7995504.1 nucleotidyltransferase family protein [Gemmatales bacterium]